MDTMSLKDILMVGIPEILLALVMSFFIFIKEPMRLIKTPVFLLKVLLSIVFIQGAIYINRHFIQDINTIALINILVYALCYWLLWKFNLRQAVCASSIIVFSLLFFDTLTMPMAEYLLQKFNNFEFYSYRFIFSLPTRIGQIFVIMFVYFFNINLNESIILNNKWTSLSIARRITTIILLSMIILTIFFNTNYVDLFVKQIKYPELNTGKNMTIILVETLLFLAITLILFNRTNSYEYYKQLLSKDPVEVFNLMLDKSNILEAREYEKMLIEHFDNLKMKGVETNEKNT